MPINENDAFSIVVNQRVFHVEYGEGIVLALLATGYCNVFFSGGERIVPLATLREVVNRSQSIIAGCCGDHERLVTAQLVWLAYALPIMDGATALTSARIDLLPHQVVLTHKVATNSPRRYLIADEVGLGKTIETALILRELASRGELSRALMIVPAGLVNNWHRELNEVFSLNFEIFGSEGDVFDRKSNAFAKHDRLIASIDTLKRPARLKKLQEAPPWDLVVFDEAHHLTAYRIGRKLKKTENFVLAEAVKKHCRDLLLLSATPHQGDHFRFWMLIQLLDPGLFRSEEEMLDYKHRLNQVVFRRTKADACRPDGSTLFARRLVHTESFLMSDSERRFYADLQIYLMDGFALAKKIGNKGRPLGFVMAIFQKIAASSFAAVSRTLRKRLIALTVQEGLHHESKLDIDRRDMAFNEARDLIMKEYGLDNDQFGRITAEGILTDLKRRILSEKLSNDEMNLIASEYSSEVNTPDVDAAVFGAVELALPEERSRIRDLLVQFPNQRETKVLKLLDALERIWKQNPDERIVIFATYLGSVEMLDDAIREAFPQKGIVVLKGGDHGSKLAAEKKFKQVNGPKVMICTAAGREGINLQHARILFNFDLPWNPMDLEQRIGRIHRYGQQFTAQVYNLVLSDTIEGKIFMLLDDKLTEIARTLGKVDEQGEVAEDLRIQILGQLSERLQYEKLYSQALSDPELKRTKEELDAALQNAIEAREMVFNLFQDLSGFSLDDYKPFSDLSKEMDRLLFFLKTALEREGKHLSHIKDDCYRIVNSKNENESRMLTIARNRSLEDENLDLLGLDYPPLLTLMERYRSLPPSEIGVCVQSPDHTEGVLSLWSVVVQGKGGDVRSYLLPLAVDVEGKRNTLWEHHVDNLFQCKPTSKRLANQVLLLKEYIEPMLQRELVHRGLINETHGYTAVLVGWIEGIGV